MSNPSQYTSHQVDANGYINYSEQEHQIWQQLYARQINNLPGKACQQYLDGIGSLNMSVDRIPQLPDIDKVLKATTGWETAAVPALISFAKFFELLANKRFPVATFIRTKEEFDYLQEPDIFHEIFGHCPLLTNPAFANFSHLYGKLGLAASKEQRVFLARLYWFTVEFGLMQASNNTTNSTENNGFNIYGGGIMSSPGETQYALSNRPIHKPFNLQEVLRTPYRIDIMQPIYYVIENIDYLDEIAKMDIMGEVTKAQSLGLFKPLFDSPKQAG
ncbi:phenylalanine 4-monooxygenase [Shewanella intestini]|uniref:Phenylalanine-4-hydroxylase n=1 Tax=Shewanella intestini TaxID=2017544 RepID=A0ABS5HYY1_9GAMM|nr:MULTISPECIES: phenylalanine 4-monooxygenase [Shewanella]MBR9726846.1 phenylalanine 4-monooxygenase [Shewanella intestini]MRG34588.1 phenylalanine 4-monooxygenase [Shewanella sp. XMDDZSB0408]